MIDRPTEDDDAPLDAAQLRLQARLTRLLAYSGGIMALGLVAVFAAILYKVKWAEQKPTLDPTKPAIVETLALPEGGRIVESRLEGATLVVTIDHPKGGTVLIVDAATLKPLRRLELTRP
jgi:hypothetical protein